MAWTRNGIALGLVAALRFLRGNGMRREDRKGVVDKVAAAVILQEYLDWQAQKSAAGEPAAF